MMYLKKILFLFNSSERKEALILIFMILLMALLDMVGIASIMPFMAVLTNPQIVESNFFLSQIFIYSKFFGVNDLQHFLFFLGVVVFILLVISLSVKSLSTYMQLKFVQNREYSISKRLLNAYLNQPYSWFLNQNSANLGKNILSEVNIVVTNCINPLMAILTQGAVAIALIFLLIIVNYKIALIVSITFIISYALIFLISRNFLKKIGQDHVLANQQRFNSISEAFDIIKMVKLSSLEKYYYLLYKKPAKNFANYQVYSLIIKQLPRYGLELLAFGGMMILLLYLMVNMGGLTTALPIITLYAFCAYRLLPAIQLIYGSMSLLRYSGPALDTIYQDLNSLEKTKHFDNIIKINFENKIELKNIYFNYPNSLKQTLKNISLSINANSTTGIIGKTGSGKTTLIDIIIGILDPSNGNLFIDGKVINKENNRSWQRLIGYVPQHISLVDDTVAANIALGVHPSKINKKSLEEAAKIAEIHSFIVDELPKGYNNVVGERGVRLSGGQRQRIGIARALYHNPKLIVFDEATSALDNVTENDVMNSINNLKEKVTIIIIAHRLSTLKGCDNVFLIENGEIKKLTDINALDNSNFNFNN